jgi:hypothetical protein
MNFARLRQAFGTPLAFGSLRAPLAARFACLRAGSRPLAPRPARENREKSRETVAVSTTLVYDFAASENPLSFQLLGLILA